MENYNTLKSVYGYTLAGGYLKGANPYVFGSNTKNYDIGLEVLGEGYDFKKPLVDVTKYNSPAVSCGTLSSLISSGIEKIDNMALKAEGVFGPNMRMEKMNFMKDFTTKLIKASLPIAYGEGVDDDELKEDISVLLKQSKEEFEKRVQQNEEEIKKEKDDTLSDDQSMENQTEDAGENPEEGSEGDNEDYSDAGDNFFEGNEDSENEDGEGEPDEDTDTEDDDGWQEDNENPDEEAEDTEADDNENDDSEDGEEESEGDLSEEDIPDGNLEGNAESYNGFKTKADRLLYQYNSGVNYKENEKYRYGATYSNIPKPEMKAMAESLLKIEEANFKAIGEQFSFNDIRPGSRLQEAHKKYVEANASILVMKRKLGLNY